MRDGELLLALLREMAASQDGRSNMVKTLGMGEEEQRRCHHMELLADAGLAEWDGRKFPRITNAGYDFIEAVDKNQKCMTGFLDKLRAGIPLLQAVKATLDLLA